MRLAVPLAAILLLSGCSTLPWFRKPAPPPPVVTPAPPVPQPSPPPPRVSRVRPHAEAPREVASTPPADPVADQRARCVALAKQRESDAKMIGVDGSALQKVHHDYFTECMSAAAP